MIFPIIYTEGIFSHGTLKYHLTHCAAIPYRPFVYAVVVARIMMVRPHLFISQKLTNKITKKKTTTEFNKMINCQNCGLQNIHVPPRSHCHQHRRRNLEKKKQSTWK